MPIFQLHALAVGLGPSPAQPSITVTSPMPPARMVEQPEQHGKPASVHTVSDEGSVEEQVNREEVYMGPPRESDDSLAKSHQKEAQDQAEIAYDKLGTQFESSTESLLDAAPTIEELINMAQDWDEEIQSELLSQPISNLVQWTQNQSPPTSNESQPPTHPEVQPSYTTETTTSTPSGYAFRLPRNHKEEREMVKAGRKTKAAVLLEKLKRRKEDADQLKEWEGRDVPPHLTSTQISSRPSTATMRTPSIQSTSDSFSRWINPGQSSNTLLQSPSAPPANQGARTLAPATPGSAGYETDVERDQWRPFISTIYNIIHIKPYTYANSDRRIAMTGSYFTGKALAAYWVLVERKVKGDYVPELEDWNTFLETFAKMFGHENEALMAWVKISNTKQKEKESFSDFYLRFAEAAVDTGYDAITLHHLLLTYINKHFRGRLMLASQLPETYEGLVAMLRSMDATEQTFLQSGMLSPFQFFWSNLNRMTPQTSMSCFSGYTHEDYNCKETTSVPARRANDTVQQVEEQKKTMVVGLPSPANQKPTTQQMMTHQTTFRVAGVSQEEMNRRRAAKACLICGHQGHFMVNCPDRAVTARMAYAQDEELDEPYWSIGMDGTVDFVDPGEMDS
ncbi:hypothetical protein VNI00_018325 [Paramarasmius palmivorus]|uniref:CCHC-type domain-containing protein n=1 Tax=Paramarasmius palmivorus TaxID=297713 RepID=A0AAW0AZH2_9AGAR